MAAFKFFSCALILPPSLLSFYFSSLFPLLRSFLNYHHSIPPPLPFCTFESPAPPCAPLCNGQKAYVLGACLCACLHACGCGCASMQVMCAGLADQSSFELRRQLVELHVLAQVPQLIRRLLGQRVAKCEEVDDSAQDKSGDVDLD